MIREISNWGNYPVQTCDIQDFPGEKNILPADPDSFIMRGLGRSYGDASLGKKIYSSLRQNHMISFDPDTGILVAESGISLGEILETFMHRGYFLPVTPGTKYVTLGGAVAADVHGKNHHTEGSFCDHVEYLDLMTPARQIIRCSSRENAEWFQLTRGGMGLTGTILRVALRLKKIETGWIQQRNIKAANFKELCALFEQHRNVTYSVAWVDCLARGKHAGRSILMLGEHAKAEDLQSAQGRKTQLFPAYRKPGLSVPFFFPEKILNPLSVKTFNYLYYISSFSRDTHFLTTCENYFYPLDSINYWNRIYGKRGFVQYQFVLPFAGGADTMQYLLEKISQKGFASFLAVLKVFGKQEGILAFPMEGYTLALDFPISHGLLEFLNELDAIVLNAGGRIYLAKDARMSAEMFHKSYGDAAIQFREKLKNLCPENKISSSLSERLQILYPQTQKQK